MYLFKSLVIFLMISLFATSFSHAGDNDSQLIETTVTVLSCPNNPADEMDIDEKYFLETLKNEAEKFCDEEEKPDLKDVIIKKSSVGWGGNNPVCGFYRRTKVNIKFKCILD